MFLKNILDFNEIERKEASLVNIILLIIDSDCDLSRNFYIWIHENSRKFLEK